MAMTKTAFPLFPEQPANHSYGFSLCACQHHVVLVLGE
jgi:hypothetical protein